MIIRPFFVVENLNNFRPYGNTNMREPCSTSTAGEIVGKAIGGGGGAG